MAEPALTTDQWVAELVAGTMPLEFVADQVLADLAACLKARQAERTGQVETPAEAHLALIAAAALANMEAAAQEARGGRISGGGPGGSIEQARQWAVEVGLDVDGAGMARAIERLATRPGTVRGLVR